LSRGFSDDDLVLSYLSENLLKSEGRIINEDKFTDFVSKLESSRIENKIEINGLEIDDVNQFISMIEEDPTILESKIIDNEMKLEEFNKLILIASEKKIQEKNLMDKKENMEFSQSELTRFKSWNNEGLKQYEKNIHEQEEFDMDVKEIEKQLITEKNNINHVKNELETKKQEIEDLQSRIGRVNEMWDDIVDELGRGFAYNQNEQISMRDLQLELQRGLEVVKKIRQDNKKFITKHDLLMPKFTELLPYTSRGEFIEQMIELSLNIDEEREKIENEWNHLFDNITRSANLMKNSIKIIKQEVSGINKIFNNIQVSNLDKFFVELKMNSNNLDYFSELNSFSKYDTDASTIQSMERIGKEMVNRRSINLTDEFRLEFQVRFKGAKKAKIVTDLDKAGSTGTIVLIKAVLLMILLYKRIQSKSERIPIPFFLDEVGVFGANNKGQIVEVARELDFQIFTASPDSMEDADIVYPILGGRENDRILVTSNMRISQKYSLTEEE